MVFLRQERSKPECRKHKARSEKIEARASTKTDHGPAHNLSNKTLSFLTSVLRSFLSNSKMSISIFSELRTTYSTWPALKAYLTSAEGGSLRVDDFSTPENPFALIRYVKGRSDLSMTHVRAFRSVVWDTMYNLPVSVTPAKSVDGESLPDTVSTEGFRIEHFVDGVLMGMFWDNHNNNWRIHTRSVLGANSRYFSQTKTFATMFAEATRDLDLAALDKRCSYTWILQHPENRIVVPVDRPRAFIVGTARIGADGAVNWEKSAPLQNPQDVAALQALRDVAESAGVRLSGTYATAAGIVHDPLGPFTVRDVTGLRTWDEVRTALADWNTRFRHAAQGLVVHGLVSGQRWKIRTPEYTRVRKLRGNSARRDYLWLDLWHSNGLRDYLTLYPEERVAANATVDRWKRATNDVFHIYTDVFKARTLPKTAIPPKYRPLVFGLHTKYMEELKPAGRSIDWRTALEYMNSRDTAQKLFVLNWELRQAAQQLGVGSIPLEPPAALGAEVKETEA